MDLGFNFGFRKKTKTEDKDLMTWYHKIFLQQMFTESILKTLINFLNQKNSLKPKTVSGRCNRQC